jgi:hypothetical protein
VTSQYIGLALSRKYDINVMDNESGGTVLAS